MTSDTKDSALSQFFPVCSMILSFSSPPNRAMNAASKYVYWPALWPLAVFLFPGCPWQCHSSWVLEVTEELMYRSWHSVQTQPSSAWKPLHLAAVFLTATFDRFVLASLTPKSAGMRTIWLLELSHGLKPPSGPICRAKYPIATYQASNCARTLTIADGACLQAHNRGQGIRRLVWEVSALSTVTFCMAACDWDSWSWVGDDAVCEGVGSEVLAVADSTWWLVQGSSQRYLQTLACEAS